MKVDVKNVSPENIKHVVAAIRSDGSKGNFEFGTERSPLYGKQCWIFVLSFGCNQVWAVRVPVKSNHLSAMSIKNLFQYEIDILARLTELNFSYSPRLIASDTSFDNPLKYPYSVFTWIEGKPLQWSDIVPASDLARIKIIHRIVDFTLDLAKSTVYDSGIPASQHLIKAVDRRIARILEGKLTENKLHDCLILRILIKKAFDTANNTSLCMISHNDLAPQNIIIDNDHNIKGIIDWGFAMHVPLPIGLVFPRFMSLEPPTLFGELVPLDSQNFSSKFLQPSISVQRDRKEYLSYLGHLSDHAQDEISKYALLNMSKPQYDWQQLIFEAVHSKGLFRWLAQHKWLYEGQQDEWIDITANQASFELDNFLDGDVARNLKVNRSAAIEFL